jgi:hypothetical protein
MAGSPCPIRSFPSKLVRFAIRKFYHRIRSGMVIPEESHLEIIDIETTENA